VAETVKSKLLELTRNQLPVGLAQNDEVAELWIEDAAEKINARRQKTTLKETSISLVEDTYTYDLPDDCQRVSDVILETDNLQQQYLPNFPEETLPSLTPGSFGTLPTGQQVNASIDLIVRQRGTRAVREVQWRILAGRLVIDFLPVEEKSIKVIYMAEDRTVEDVPKRHWIPITKKCRAEAIGVFLGELAFRGDAVGDALIRTNVDALRREKRDLEREWEEHLAGIIPETA
jgi:hypothetical protein